MPVDSGPTVFTMRWVFEAIFAAVGARLEDHLTLRRAEVLARHHWLDGSTLDLFADEARSADAIGALCGAAEARRFLAFGKRTREVFSALNGPFMENPSPSPIGLARAAGLGGLAALTRIQPFTALWNVLGTYFHDPRLRQLFGRYATYCGSSPFDAPGPLMIIAAVEQMGVWLVEGGMLRIADALETVAASRGAAFRYDAPVAEILTRGKAATGVRLASGEVIAADAVVFNGDPAALFSGLLGDGRAPGRRAVAGRSAVALGADMVDRRPGTRLCRCRATRCSSRATIAASSSGPARQRPAARRSDDLCLRAGPRRIRRCAHGRRRREAVHPGQRAFHGRQATARRNGDTGMRDEGDAAAGAGGAGDRRAAAGDDRRRRRRILRRLFPATGGALYGRASHGWAASFQRPWRAADSRASIWRAGRRIRARGCRWRPCRAATRPPAVISDLGFDRLGPDGWLRLVVCRRDKRRRHERADRHRLHRQRVFALLCARAATGAAASRRTMSASTPSSTCRAPSAGR